MRIFKASLLFITMFTCAINSYSVWDIYKSGLSINGGYYDCLLNTASPEFQHTNFGRYTTGGTITLNFAEVLTYKNGASNVCSANLYYRVYRSCDTPPAFSVLSLPYCCDFGGTNCTGGGCGPDINNPGDQKWRGTSGTNLLTGQTLPGMYVIEVYYDATGDDAGGCTNTKYSSNSSNNYRAYFELNINDSFTDSDFFGPNWAGDTGSLQITDNSVYSNLIGSEQTQTNTMKLNAASGPGSQYASTLVSTWDAQQEWYFWIGRDNVSSHATAANQIQVWLFGSESNLESNSVDGYRIAYGDDSGGDEVRLQLITDGTVITNIITSSTSTANGLLDYGIAIRVTRSQTNVWTLYTSTLPQNPADTQTTPSAISCVESSATVNQGSGTEGTYAISGNGYVGPVFVHSSGADARTGAEFDNLRVVPLPPNTQVEIAGLTSGSVNEDVANTGNLAIQVSLVSPSPTLATTVDLVLTSGAAARAGRGTAINTNYAGPYTTITLTWPAATSGIQTVYIDPVDNTLCDDIATLVFTLQNITGGNSAFIDAPSAYTATIIDDNTGYETLINETFESGSIPVQWTTTGTAWSANNTAPITGLYSARHSTQASAGTSSIAHPLDDVSLPGVNTTWRFQIKYTNDPSANNNFQVFLSGNEANLFSPTVDGYAVVVDQASLPNVSPNDYIRLYRVDNGAYAATPIVNSTTDWDSNVGGGNKVGFEVTLNDAGTWEIKVDISGDFDNLVSLGTGVDLVAGGLTYPLMQNFGVRYRYTAGVSNFIRFDDVTVSQKGCKELWYSQGSGNVTAAIWSQSPVGVPSAVIGGRYKRFSVQGSATGDNIPDNVTINSDWIVNDISIDAGGTLTSGAFTTRVFGNWVNSGAFAEGTSTIHFKGQAAQSILGSTSTQFRNMVIDNDGFNVTLAVATSATGVITPVEGTLQTGGLLTLVSNIAGTASIGTINITAGAAVSGNVTLQRYTPYIPWVYGNWVNLGCPIQGQTIADWNDDIITTGFTGSDFPAPYPFNNIRSYTESTAGSLSLGYVNAANVTDALTNAAGYFVWMQGGAQNLDNTGAIQSGTFDHSLSYTVTGGGVLNDGWNLMTNAYPSEVDWNLISSTFGGGNPRVHYVFDHQTNSYKTWNAVSNTGTGSRYIPSSQSFLVKVNGVGQNLHYEETYKTNTGAAFERSYESSNQFIALKLEHNGMSDECMLLFSSDASNEYEMMDSYDLESPNAESVEFSLLSSDNVTLAQDARPFNSDLSIPVYLDLPEAGTYTFSVVQTQNLPVGACLTIEDLLTGSTIMMQVGEQMTLSTNAPYQGNRLLIHGTAPVSITNTDATCNGAANGSIDVTAPAGNWTVTLIDQWSGNETIANGSTTFEHLPAGTYTIAVGNGSECSSGSYEVVISEPAQAEVILADVYPSLCNEGNGGSFEFNVSNADWYAYEVTNESDQIITTGILESDFGSVNELAAGNYTLKVYNTCGVHSLDVSLNDDQTANLTVSDMPSDINLIDDVVECTGHLYSSNGFIQWTCSNGQAGVGETIMLSFDQEGTYTWSATSTNGQCSKMIVGSLTVKSAPTESTTSLPIISMIQVDDQLQITFDYDMAMDGLSIELFDATGRIALSARPSSASSISVVDLKALASGAYTMRITNQDAILFTKKVVR